jgi:hypothetical protein
MIFLIPILLHIEYCLFVWFASAREGNMLEKLFFSALREENTRNFEEARSGLGEHKENLHELGPIGGFCTLDR